MTPSEKAKELGCESLVQVSKSTEQSEQTLINWFKNPKKRKLFDIVCEWTALDEEYKKYNDKN